MAADDWDRMANVLRYWHAIEMFDPQGIPALLSRRELAQREPGSWCVEAVPFLAGEPAPKLPWQVGHPRYAEPPKDATYGSEWRYIVYGGVFSFGAVREVLAERLRFTEPEDFPGTRKEGTESALFAFTVDQRGLLLGGTGAFSSCAWASGRLDGVRRGQRTALQGFEKVSGECQAAMERLLAKPGDGVPEPLKQAIESRTGHITGVRIASAGQNSSLAAVIDARDGKVFAKGLPSAHRRVITQAREAAVAPLVRDISPALLWHFDEAGWNVLGYEYAPGRHANYSPGSPDLDRLVQLMDALSAIQVPDDPGPFKRAEDRWKPYLDDPETAAVFAGPVLTHSDWTPDNVLVSEHRAWLMDWAWPTVGAAWTDPACWVLRLMTSGGHTAHEAERRASRLPAFQAADPAHIDLFAGANVRLWDEVARSSTRAWTTKMAQAARSWAAYRQARWDHE